MRRLCADREEKRVTRGSDISGQGGEQEQLDLNDPNQRSLLGSNRPPGSEGTPGARHHRRKLRTVAQNHARHSIPLYPVHAQRGIYFRPKVDGQKTVTL
jgi:hypothetical protein